MNWSKLMKQLEPLVIDVSKNGVHKSKDTLLKLLESYTAHYEDFEKYVHFNEAGYTKNLVKVIGQDVCNVIVMCWSPRQQSAYHAHEGSQCFVKVLQGRLLEQQLTYPSLHNPTRVSLINSEPQTNAKCLNTNQVTYIDDSVGLHRVINQSEDQSAITLHVYLPPYTKCRVFQPEIKPQVQADKSDGQLEISIQRSNTLDVTFDSVDGNVVAS